MMKRLAFVIFVAFAACEAKEPVPCDGQEGCECSASTPCDGGLVCDGVSATCRDPKTCAELECVADQQCVEASAGADASCQDACAVGMTWDVAVARCVPSFTTCDDGPTGIASRCAADNRTCVPGSDADAECGGCVAGFVSEAGSCRAVRMCADLGTLCSDEKRTCVEGTDVADAYCAACAPSEVSGAGDACIPATCEGAGEGSIESTCEAQSRVCVADASGARCTDCIAGFVVGSDGACREVRSCLDEGCAVEQRLCNPAGAHEDATCGACRAGFAEQGNACVALNVTCAELASACDVEHRTCGAGACTACASGFVLDPESGLCRAPIDCATCTAEGKLCEDVDGVNVCGGCAAMHKRDPATGACVATKTCASLVCEAGEVCVPEAGNADAYCQKDCGPTAVYDGIAATCVACPACDGEGEDGIAPTPTAAGECVCKTKDHFFFTRAGEIGTYPCDADGDGWVREAARAAIDSEDPVIRDNARCHVRTVHTIRFVNDQGQTQDEVLPEPLTLYESTRNDDDALLRAMFGLQGVDTPFGSDTGGERLWARHVNSLTKYCHSAQADFNDNGVPDVSEYGGMPVTARPRPDVEETNKLSYFAELHQAEFVADPGKAEVGVYRISERSRKGGANPAGNLSLGYENGAGNYWKECRRGDDALTQQQSIAPVGTDFAWVHGSGFDGMGHHSQFKCMVVTALPSSANVWETLPVRPPVFGEPKLTFNDCRLQATSGAGAASGNPSDARFTCSPLTSLATGTTRWASVGFVPYANGESTYQRGCLDECDELREDRYPVDDPCKLGANFGYAAPCEGRAADFGKLSCLEACSDGKDNDGDGSVDNPPAALGALNATCLALAQGECASGKVQCFEGGFQCVAATPGPVDACDGKDNDCDGTTDETPEEKTADGKRQGDVCDVASALGECKKGSSLCKNGGFVCEQTVQPGDNDEVCDGKDNDCNGTVDMGEDGKVLSEGPCEAPADAKGVCAEWEKICVAGNPFYVNDVLVQDFSMTCKQKVEPSAEKCDLLDNDCDGIVDEDGACDCETVFPKDLPYWMVDDFGLQSGDTEFNPSNRAKLEFTLTPTIGDNSAAIDLRAFARVDELQGDSAYQADDLIKNAVTTDDVAACATAKGASNKVSLIVNDTIGFEIVVKEKNQFAVIGTPGVITDSASNRRNIADIFTSGWIYDKDGSSNDSNEAATWFKVKIRYRLQPKLTEE